MSTPDASRPPYGAANPFSRFVTLTATVTVDGHTLTGQQQIDVAAWEYISADARLRADYEQALRHQLATALVERLSPAVTVQVPVTPAEAVSAALKRADAAVTPWA